MKIKPLSWDSGFQFVEKGYFYKNRVNSLSLTPNPFPVVKGCVCFVGSASCRAFGHTRPASMPGLSVGLPPLDPVGGYAPNPIFKNYIGFSTACSLCKKAEAYINQLLSDKVMLSALFPSVSKITISFLPFFRSGAGIYSFF